MQRGVDLYNPQWFTVPVGNLGKIYAHGTAWGIGARSPEDFPFGVAVVDTTTGAVVTCGEDPITATTANDRCPWSSTSRRPTPIVTRTNIPVATANCTCR